MRLLRPEKRKAKRSCDLAKSVAEVEFPSSSSLPVDLKMEEVAACVQDSGISVPESVNKVLDRGPVTKLQAATIQHQEEVDAEAGRTGGFCAERPR